MKIGLVALLLYVRGREWICALLSVYRDRFRRNLVQLFITCCRW